MKVKTFNFTSCDISIETLNGQLWFCASDVAKAIEYKGQLKNWDRWLDGTEKLISSSERSGQRRKMIYISESGLYKVLLKVETVKAKPFSDWVTKEVLPEIRETGSYSGFTKPTTEDRKKSKKVRNDFTGTLSEHGISKSYEFINITRNMKKPLGITAKKDDMSRSELLAVQASEALAECMLSITDVNGYHFVNPVCVDASQTVSDRLTRLAGPKKPALL